MIYYAYFDSYGHVRQVISQEELTRFYNNDPDAFREAMSQEASDAESERAAGQVSALVFENEKELHDFLESLGDEIMGFYGCREGSRPYNF